MVAQVIAAASAPLLPELEKWRTGKRKNRAWLGFPMGSKDYGHMR